mgnify:FL=1
MDTQSKLQGINAILESSNYEGVYWLKHGGMWPSVKPVTILETLRSTSKIPFTDRLRDILVKYALSITALQRLLRLEDASKKGNLHRLAEEQENTGHHNWNPSQHPDWVLLEIDANVLIRPGQIDVALATISPASDSNSVLQMNMVSVPLPDPLF